MNNIMIKQDPVMVANHKDEPPDPEDFILQDSLPLFDNRYLRYLPLVAVNCNLSWEIKIFMETAGFGRQYGEGRLLCGSFEYDSGR
jgi:hypothetical protein